MTAALKGVCCTLPGNSVQGRGPAFPGLVDSPWGRDITVSNIKQVELAPGRQHGTSLWQMLPTGPGTAWSCCRNQHTWGLRRPLGCTWPQ